MLPGEIVCPHFPQIRYGHNADDVYCALGYN